MQDPNPDDDPRTSEGIYVYTHKARLRAANASVGDAVTVRGHVAEFIYDPAGLPLTEIVTAQEVWTDLNVIFCLLVFFLCFCIQKPMGHAGTAM